MFIRRMVVRAKQKSQDSLDRSTARARQLQGSTPRARPPLLKRCEMCTTPPTTVDSGSHHAFAYRWWCIKYPYHPTSPLSFVHRRCYLKVPEAPPKQLPQAKKTAKQGQSLKFLKMTTNYEDSKKRRISCYVHP